MHPAPSVEQGYARGSGERVIRIHQHRYDYRPPVPYGGGAPSGVFPGLAADAPVSSYYLADLDPILERYGNRGYGLVQLESALFAGRLHLAAHAAGLRAVGSTSLDDDVVEFFSPRAAGSSYMFVTVFGLRRLWLREA